MNYKYQENKRAKNILDSETWISGTSFFLCGKDLIYVLITFTLLPDL